MTILDEQCPGLVVLISQYLGASSLPLIATDYELAARGGGNTEPGLSRDEGVSYTPRLARVLSILLKDHQSRDVGTLRAALHVAADSRGRATELLEESLRVGHEGATPDTRAEKLNRELLAIDIAVALDAVRHLHMSSLDTSSKMQVLAHAESVAARAPEDVSPQVLVTKLRHAVSLQARVLHEQ